LRSPSKKAKSLAVTDCLFCKIIAREIPAELVFQDDLAVAIRDINPQAPTHLLIMPRKHISSLLELQDDDASLVGHLQLLATELARKEKLTKGGFRLVINCGEGAGQSVFHIHVHLLGGRPMKWPPG